MVASITIGARLEVRGLPANLTELFIQENDFPNPKRETLERLGFWTGDEPDKITLWRREGDRLLLPRGYFPAAVSELKKAGLPFVIEDRTVCPTLEALDVRGSLYGFQRKALDDLLRYPTGVLEAPTGSGKTNILLSAVAHLNTPALILTHTRELLNQTADRVRSWLGVEAGIIGGGKWRMKPVTVAMVQTLARNDLREKSVAEYFGAVLIDEAHHSPATTWAGILEQLPARYKYGFTATAWRKDGLQFLMWRLIGNRTAQVTRSEVEEAGRIVWPDVETVETAYFYSITESSEWTAMVSDLIQDGTRNRLIEREVRSRLTAESRALVLTDRIEHANIMATLLQDLEPVLLTGALSKSERKDGMAAVRAGTRLTIATVHLLGEGVDVPGWDLLFLVSPIAGGPRTLQAVGRVARPAPGKSKATVVDFVDSRIPVLAGAARSRSRLYD